MLFERAEMPPTDFFKTWIILLRADFCSKTHYANEYKNVNTLCKYTHTPTHALFICTQQHTQALSFKWSWGLYPATDFKALQSVHNNTTVNTLPHLHETRRMKNIKGCNQESEKVKGQVNSIRECFHRHNQLYYCIFNFGTCLNVL